MNEFQQSNDTEQEQSPFPHQATKIIHDSFEFLIQFQEACLKTIESFEIDSYSFSPFDTEILSKIVVDAHEGIKVTFLEEPETWHLLQQRYLDDLEKLFQVTLDQCVGEVVEPIIIPEKNDRRFRGQDWEQNPIFNYMKQAYLLHARYLQSLISNTKVDDISKKKLIFFLKSLMDVFAPTNFPLTNPDVIRESLKRGGDNLIEGYHKFIKDQTEHGGAFRLPSLDKLTAFEVGKNLAATPGEIVFENEIFQLVQFHPMTPDCFQKPLLIVPPWINKYYIFDLRTENSFIRWNLERGRSVFVISWVNPDASYAELGFADYVLRGVGKAVDQVQKITKQPMSALGFCVGGVALMTYLSHVSSRGERPIESASFLATPVDFEQLNELSVFVCEDQVKILDKQLKEHGVLAGNSMVKMFSALRANDLIWSNYINSYLLAKDPNPLDFLYWNSDTTNLPGKMHIEYLRNFFLNNIFMQKGKRSLDGIQIDLSAITIPAFVMGAQNDHIVPWKAAFSAKKHFKNAHFVLSASGHVAGIINPPNQNKYCYWVNPDPAATEADDWFTGAAETKGSWWLEWERWIEPNLGPKVPAYKVNPESIIEHAPGRYVTQTASKGFDR